jgi:hypothetical protein
MNDQRLSNLEQWRRSAGGEFGNASQASGSIHPGLMHNTGAMQLGVIPYPAEMGDMGPPSNNNSGQNPNTVQMGYDPMFGYQPRSGSANPGLQEGTSVVSPMAPMGPGPGGLSTGSANVRDRVGCGLKPQADTCTAAKSTTIPKHYARQQRIPNYNFSLRHANMDTGIDLATR